MLDVDALDLASLDERALRCAVEVAAQHGVRSSSPTILKSGSNLVVHLAPAPVVARVTTTTALVRPDPAAYAERELAVVRFLVSRGVDVVHPSDALPPGPHARDGLVVTYWRFTPHDAARASVDDARAHLGRLHDALADYRGALPFLSPALDDTALALAAVERWRALDDVKILRARHDALVPRLRALENEGAQAIHGDGHANNLLLNGARAIWSDFEDTCRGPRGWDEMCLLRKTLARDSLDDATRLLFDARSLQAAAWTALFALRFPERFTRADAEQLAALAAR